jgi:colanic acid/amylovoran biosynthesis protein
MRIAITASLVANGGDAAILLGTIRELREALGPDVRFTVYDGLTEVARAHYPEFDVRPALYGLVFDDRPKSRLARKTRFLRFLVGRPRLNAFASALRSGKSAAERLLSEGEREALRALAAHDLVVASGGTYLVETYWLGPMLFELGLVRQLGLPLVLGSQSLGPFRKRGVRRALRPILDYARLVLVRDERSRGHALDVAPAARVAAAADAAFALADPAVLVEAQARTLPADRPLRVGVSVRDWPHFTEKTAGEGMRRYREAVGALVVHLVRARGAEVRFFSTCQGLRAYRFDDARVAAEIVGELPDDVRARVEVVTEYLRPERMMAEAARCDLVVATRMHAAILSLCAGTPVLPIAYEFKTREVFGRLGAERWVQDIETITEEGLVASAEAFLEALPRERAALFVRVEAERAGAMASGALVAEAVGA